MPQSPGLRERKNARTREAIERAALELTLEQGYEHTTVDQIAARADMSPRTVFTRYATKDAIVFGADQSGAAFRAALERGEGDVVDRILALIESERTRADADQELEALRLRAILADPTLRPAFRGRLDEAEALIVAQLSAELGLAPDDAGVRVFAAAAIGFFLALIEVGLRDGTSDGLVEKTGSGVAVLRASLQALRAQV